MSLTPTERTMRARLAAHTLHSRVAGQDITRAATAAGPASLPYFERKVDPDGLLDAGERRRRAEHARKAHYISMGLKSAAARRQRKAS